MLYIKKYDIKSNLYFFVLLQNSRENYTTMLIKFYGITLKSILRKLDPLFKVTGPFTYVVTTEIAILRTTRINRPNTVLPSFQFHFILLMLTPQHPTQLETHKVTNVYIS